MEIIFMIILAVCAYLISKEISCRYSRKKNKPYYDCKNCKNGKCDLIGKE